MKMFFIILSVAIPFHIASAAGNCADIDNVNSVQQILCTTAPGAHLQGKVQVVRTGDKLFKISYQTSLTGASQGTLAAQVAWSGHFWIIQSVQKDQNGLGVAILRTRNCDADDASLLTPTGTLEPLSCEMNP